MNGEAVYAINEISRNPRTEEIDGVTYVLRPAADGWAVEDVRKADPEPKIVTLHTLTGLVDYLSANRDVLPLAECLLHVESHAQVVLRSKLKGHFQQRLAYVRASFAELLGDQSSGFSFGQFLDAERFNIALQTLFEDTPGRAAVLQVIGTIKEESVRTSNDDGITQMVKASAGIVSVAEIPVPNPVDLSPYRTFREVPQPASKFVLRLKAGKMGDQPTCALFEADGGRWKLDAIASIASYLKGGAPSELAVIA